MAGRPKKPESDTLSYMLRVRMSEEDRELLAQAAKLKSLELSTWVRSEMVTLARRIISQNARE